MERRSLLWALFPNNNKQTGFQPSYSLDTASLGVIAQDGTFTAGNAWGKATLTAAYKGKTAQAVITIEPDIVSLSISPPSASLYFGDTQKFEVRAKQSNGNEYVVQPQFALSPQTLGTISADGTFTAGKVAESGSLAASYCGFQTSSSLNVRAFPSISLYLDPDSQSAFLYQGQETPVLLVARNEFSTPVKISSCKVVLEIDSNKLGVSVYLPFTPSGDWNWKAETGVSGNHITISGSSQTGIEINPKE